MSGGDRRRAMGYFACYSVEFMNQNQYNRTSIVANIRPKRENKLLEVIK